MVRYIHASKIIFIGVLCFTTLFTLAPLLGQSVLTFDISRAGATTTYHAVSQTTPSAYSGTLKFVVESAVSELNASGGGNIVFAAGDFDLGTDYFKFVNRSDVTFTGQGMDVTVVHNWTDAVADTEPFNCYNCDRLIIRDMTVSAGGPVRTSSDALDFDRGDDNLIERIKVTNSRGRGIVFDGKDPGGTAERNIIRDCIIAGPMPLDGIQLLGSSHNRIEGCVITGVDRHGIHMNKASSTAGQPDKPSDDNVIIGNLIKNVGNSGITVNSGNRNLITDNTISNSAFNGVYIISTLSFPCNDNIVEFNTAAANQHYGLNIADSECNRTVVRDNNFSGNFLAAIRDNGTATIYTGSPTNTPIAANAAPVHNYYVSLPFKLTWNPVSWAVAYEIQVDSSPNFILPLDFSAIAANTSTEAFIHSLSEGRYYWHVRAQKGDKTWGSWSATAQFTFDNP